MWHNNGYYRNFQDAQQAAFGFLVAQITQIEASVYRIQYPDIQYPNLVPVDTSGNEWMKSVTFFSMDQAGKAQWLHAEASDIPLADLTKEKFEQGIELAAIGYRYNTEELMQSMMIPGFNLGPEKAAAARRAYEEFVDDKGLRGDTTKGWTGIYNAAGVTVLTAANDGTGSARTWASKTFAQIVRDFNSMLSPIYLGSLQLELPDTVLLPIDLMSFLGSTQVTNTTMTVLEWLREHNMITNQTGRPLQITGVRGLETAGSGGVGRAVAYRKDPDVLKMHIPMPHRFLPPWPRNPLTTDIPGIFRLGGLEVRRPGAMRYLDAIS